MSAKILDGEMSQREDNESVGIPAAKFAGRTVKISQ
jgi:hypothetical protein